MKKILLIVPRWLPALVVMTIIFWFSSRPGGNGIGTPATDYFIKKTAHICVYAALSFAYFHMLKYSPKYYWLAWLLAILFAVTDEYHQSFVRGRTPSALDVLLFDNIGAMVGLWLSSKFWKADA